MAENYTTFPITFNATFGDGLPTTTNTDPVLGVKEILEGAEDFGIWNQDPPEIRKQWNWSPDQRENSKDPAIYLWSPIEGETPAFDAEYSHVDEFNTVECSVWTLDENATISYADRIIDLFGEYANDNELRTPFNRLRPDNPSDLRSEKIATKTDHYVTNIQIGVRRFREAGL